MQLSLELAYTCLNIKEKLYETYSRICVFGSRSGGGNPGLRRSYHEVGHLL